MRILYYINGIHRDGKERRFLELLRVLASSDDIEATLVVMSEEVHYPEILSLGIQVKYLLRSSRFDARILLKLNSLRRQIRPDIIHTWDFTTSVYAAPVAMINLYRSLKTLTDDAAAQEVQWGANSLHKQQHEYTEKSLLVLFQVND